MSENESNSELQTASELIDTYFKSVNQELQLQVYADMGCQVSLFRWEEAAKQDKKTLFDYLNDNFSTELETNKHRLQVSKRKISVSNKGKEYSFIFYENRNKVILEINKSQNREFILKLEDGMHRLYIDSQPSKFSAERLVYSIHGLGIPLTKSLEITHFIVEKIKKNFPLNGIIYSSEIVEMLKKTIEKDKDVDPILIQMFERRYRKTGYVEVDCGGKQKNYSFQDKKIRSLIINIIKEEIDDDRGDLEYLYSTQEVSSKWVVDVRETVRRMGVSVISERTLRDIIFDLATRPPVPWININPLKEEDIRGKIREIKSQLIDIEDNYTRGRYYLLKKDIQEALDNIAILILNRYNLRYMSKQTKPFDTLKKFVSTPPKMGENNLIKFTHDLERLSYKNTDITKTCNYLHTTRSKFSVTDDPFKGSKTFSEFLTFLESLFFVSKRLYEKENLALLYNNLLNTSDIEEKNIRLRLLIEGIVEAKSGFFIREKFKNFILLGSQRDQNKNICLLTHLKDKNLSYNDMIEIYQPIAMEILKSQINSKIVVSITIPSIDEDAYINFINNISRKESRYLLFLDSNDLEDLIIYPHILDFIINSKLEKLQKCIDNSRKSDINQDSKSTNQKTLNIKLGINGNPLIKTQKLDLNDIETNLIKKMFQGRSYVEILNKFTSGYSETSVFRAQPFDEKSNHQINKVLKIGPANIIKEEQSNYKDNVEDYLDIGHHAQLQGYEEDSNFGIICYHFVSGDSRNILSFKDFFNNYPTDVICNLLDDLYQNVLSNFYTQKKFENVCLYDIYMEPILSNKKILDSIKKMSDLEDTINLKESNKSAMHPLRYLKKFDKQLKVPSYLSSIHGDLNANNIQIETRNNNIWLIDFYKTKQDHIIKDFAKLESVIKYELMDIDLISYIKFEECVLKDLNLDEEFFEQTGLNNNLEKNFNCIRYIRDNVVKQMYSPASFEEYLISLLYFSLSPLAWDNFDIEKKKRALYSSALIADKLIQTKSSVFKIV